MRACIAASVAVVIFVLSPIQAHGQGMGLPARVQALEAAVAALQTTVAALTAKLSSVTVESGEINGVAGPNLIFTGVNVHIRSGSGATNDGGTPTGLGNLIVGYNEEPIDGLLPGDRGGAHTLVIGPQHKFLNVGGLVAGFRNTVSDEAASVSGGMTTRPAADSRASAGELTTRRAAPVPASAGGFPTRRAASSPPSAAGRTTRPAPSSPPSAEAFPCPPPFLDSTFRNRLRAGESPGRNASEREVAPKHPSPGGRAGDHSAKATWAVAVWLTRRSAPAGLGATAR